MEELLLLMIGLEHSPNVKSIHFDNDEGNNEWIVEFHKGDINRMTTEALYQFLNVM